MTTSIYKTVPQILDTGNGGVTLKQLDQDDFTNSSILEFLKQEQKCIEIDNGSDIDIESIFEEINRLSGDTENVNVEDILKEAEMLLNKQHLGQLEIQPIPKITDDFIPFRKSSSTISLESTPREMRVNGAIDKIDLGIQELSVSLDKGDLNITNRFLETNYEIVAKSKNTILDSGKSSNNDVKSKQNFDKTSFCEVNTTDNTDTKKIKSLRRNSFENGEKIIARSKMFNTTPINRQETFIKNFKIIKQYTDKSTSPSPTTISNSPSFSFSRERNLEKEIELLQEKLKDTEERLQSLRLQHESLSQIHRVVRINESQYQEESERFKIEIQHLHECANILRAELQSARTDRAEALELQQILQKEVEECRVEKKTAVEQTEKDTKTIQDLQRQCKEMERILMRKHPDSISALIVASKIPSNNNDDGNSSRRLLEQRIAQLEADAKEQDVQAQKILSNVQSRFSSVQCKYEQHIGDLETQVLSLQQINAKLNEKIESQAKELKMVRKEELNITRTFNNTEMKSVDTITVSTQTDFKIPVAAKIQNKTSKLLTDPPHANGKYDTHLMATIRGMRVDLAIKEKAMQRLTRELEECKKTIKKLQKEKDVVSKGERSGTSTSCKKSYDPAVYSEQNGEAQNLKEASNRIKLLEYDYNALHNKRLQDLKTLQAAHERELASCHETVHILQQRLSERDEAFAMQKRRKVPVDYFALKAKVSSLERRHTEREQRLHILVEALSKGRLNGALEGIIN